MQPTDPKCLVGFRVSEGGREDRKEDERDPRAQHQGLVVEEYDEIPALPSVRDPKRHCDRGPCWRRIHQGLVGTLVPFRPGPIRTRFVGEAGRGVWGLDAEIP